MKHLATLILLATAHPGYGEGPATGTEAITRTSAPALSTADLRVTMGRSLLIDYPLPIRQISTSDPLVVDAVAATPEEFLLHGKSHGTATVVVWARSGQRTIYNVTVEHNVEPIKQLLKETFPREDIQVRAARDEVTLMGRVSTKEVSDRAAAIATPLAKTVVNNLQIDSAPVAKQIVLRVKFAEINRNAGKSFAVNLVPLGTGNTIGRVTTGQFAAPNVTIEGGETKVGISDALNIFAFRPDLNLMTFIRALQSEGLLQILAEPNLVTTSGKEASFLVGGEFPIPMAQGGASAGAITIIFREFGVRLTFNPVLTEHGTIKLYVKPEVSTLDLSNSVTISGFRIPALATRRVETNIELSQGQSFVIGGLIDDRVTETMSRIPGLSNLPVLGALFKSKDSSRSKTELVVIVTPEIAEPIPAGAPVPTPYFPREMMPSLKAPPPAPVSQNQDRRKASAKQKKMAVAAVPKMTMSADSPAAPVVTTAAAGTTGPSVTSPAGQTVAQETPPPVVTTPARASSTVVRAAPVAKENSKKKPADSAPPAMPEQARVDTMPSPWRIQDSGLSAIPGYRSKPTVRTW
ncbi:MAG: pilus assembly protein N-terminal domain-containing protein [Acidobacteria bacterium]|nr:pilus assembly protein N-terminal domain-containing protein [Acidobacteriota bacterium]